jgi:glycosyltransferase involved in cell wall biosynthesis
MKISMLMPVYSCPPLLLEKAIRSVLEQTHQDFEIVIADGNTKDPAVENSAIFNLFNSLGSKVKYQLLTDSRDDENKRSGFYMSLNRAMRLATGDVLSFLAGDDERGPSDVLSSVNERFQKHGPSPLLLYGDCGRVDLKNRPVSEHEGGFVVRPGMGMSVSNPITFDEMLVRMSLLTPAVFWNRAVYEKFGEFDETFDWAADYEYWLRIWKGVDKEYISKVMGIYRLWPTSQNSKNGELAHAQGDEIIRRYKNGS